MRVRRGCWRLVLLMESANRTVFFFFGSCGEEVREKRRRKEEVAGLKTEVGVSNDARRMVVRGEDVKLNVSISKEGRRGRNDRPNPKNRLYVRS